MSEWQPIETAPKDGTWILLFEYVEPRFADYAPAFSVAKWHTWDAWGYGKQVTGWYVSDENDHEFTKTVDDPTHWMPLPDPPQGA